MTTTPLTTHDDHLGNLLAAPAPLGLGGIIRFDHATSRWHVWNGLRWQPDTTRMVYDLIRQRCQAWWRACDDEVTPDSTGTEDYQTCALMTDAGWFKAGGRGDFRKATLPLVDTSKKEAVLKGLSARPGIAMRGDEWDRNPWQLCCANGIVDLRDGSFTRTGDPDDLITLSTGIEYDPDAETPATFLRNLDEITALADGTPDPETAHHLLLLLGYALWGDKDEEVFAQWPGTGRNGKGKQKDIILHVLGDYAGSLVPGFYTKTKWGAESSAPRPDLLDIRGKRIMFESDPEGGDLNIQRIKKHSGRDQERARDLYGRNFVTFVPSHLIVLLTNDVLKVDKVDPALEDRLLVYPFERRFWIDTDPPADTGRLAAMEAEAPGILALLVAWCVAWYKAATGGNDGRRRSPLKESITERMKLAAGRYLAANDPLRAAIEASFVREPTAWEATASLYATYCEWHGQEEDPDVAGPLLTRSDFTKGLRNGLGLVEKRRDHGQTRGFAGIRTKPFADRVSDQSAA